MTLRGKRSVRATAAATVAIAAVAVAGCGGSSDSGGSTGTAAAGGSPSTSGEKLKVIVVTHGVPSDPFWNTVQKGVTDAGADFNVETDYQSLQGAVDPGQEARLMDAAIAQKPDGIAVTIPDPSAMRAPIQKALDEGSRSSRSTRATATTGSWASRRSSASPRPPPAPAWATSSAGSAPRTPSASTTSRAT